MSEYRGSLAEADSGELAARASSTRARPPAARGLTVLVVCSLFTLPYRVMRASAAAGATVHVLGNAGSRGIARSRFCAAFHESRVQFDGVVTEAAIVEINRLVAQLRPDMVLPGDAPTTRILCGARDRIAAPCFPLPDLAAFDLLNDKWAFTQRATALGIRCPETRLYADAAALGVALAAGEIKLPAIAKPLSADGSIGVVKLPVAGAAEAAARIDYAPILIQDFIEGEDIGASIFAIDGEVRSHITHRLKRRTYAVIGDPRVPESLALLARELHLDGIYNFDMRLTADGEIYYLECNPRFFYKMDLSMIAGINFAAAGLPGRAAGVPASVPAGTIVRMPKALAADLVKPLSLTWRDWAMLSYLWRDPICYARERLGIDGENWGQALPP